MRRAFTLQLYARPKDPFQQVALELAIDVREFSAAMKKAAVSIDSMAEAMKRLTR